MRIKWVLGVLLTLAAGGAGAQGPGRYYPPDARVNLVTVYGVDNTGRREAADGINRALHEYRGTGAILYLPAGTYRLTRPIDYAADGKASQVTLMGAGPGTDPARATILRVPDGAGFHGAVVETNTNTNMAFGVSVCDLTIRTGRGNPDATGIDFHASNQGTLADISVISDDGTGMAGISLATSENGPCLVQNVTVRGFRYGIDARTDEYSLTLENVTVTGQRAGGAGLRGGGAVLAVRGLHSRQDVSGVPGVLLDSPFSHLALLDSTLTGRGGAAFVHPQGGHFLLRGVSAAGVLDHFRSEAVSDPVLTGTGQPGIGVSGQTLRLPIRATPDDWDNTPSDWVAVRKNPTGEDTQAIQGALDEAAAAHKPVVYFPRFDAHGKRIDTYYLNRGVTIRIPAGVKYVLGMGCQLNQWQAGHPYPPLAPLFRFEGGGAGGAIYFRDFRNITGEGPLFFWEHATARTVVLAHLLSLSGPAEADGGGAYRGNLGDGPLFLEDVSVGGGWRFLPGQSVWARQFNPEDYSQKGLRPLADGRGTVLWLLGFKTEGAGPWLTLEDGAAAEVFGAFQYINTGLPSFPASVVPYQVTDSRAALDFATFNFTGTDYAHYLAVTRRGVTTFRDASGLYVRDTHNPHDASRDAPLLVCGPAPDARSR